jgi:hypothetical protein
MPAAPAPATPAADAAPADDAAPAEDAAPATDAAPTRDDAPAESVPLGDEQPTRAMATVAEPPADGAAAPDPDAARNGRDAEHGVPDRPSPDPLAPEESRP